MAALATNPAVFSPSPLCVVEQANRSLPGRNSAGGLHSAKGVFGSPNTAASAMNFGSRDADENFAQACVFRLVSFARSRLRACPTPGGTARLCFYGFQKTFVQRTQKGFPNLP